MSANYQRLTPVELSWTSQNVYTGGVGETINLFPSAPLSEADENPSALTGEKLNYISGYRVPCVSGELPGGAVSVPLAPHLPYPASVRGEVAQSSGLLYTTPSPAIQVSTASNPALLVPAFLGRLPAHHQHHHGNSTAMFAEHNSSEVRSAGLVGKPMPSSGCDIGNDAGAGFAPHSLHRAQQHHSSGGVGHQHQLFSQPNGGGGSMRAPSLPAGLMELSSTPVWSNDSDMAALAVVPSQVMFAHNHQQSAAAGPQQQTPVATLNSVVIPHEVNLATRVRHNTWAGPCLDGVVAAMARRATAGRPINVPLLNGVGEASDCALGRQQQMESILSSGVPDRLDHNQQQQSNNIGHFASQRSRSAAVYMDGNFPVMPGNSLATDSLAKDNVVGYSMPRHRSFFPGNCANDVNVRNSQACDDGAAAHHSQQRSMSTSNWRSPLPWLADLSRPPPPQPPPQGQWPAHAKSDNPALLMGPPTLIGPKDPRLYPHHQAMPGSGGMFGQVPRLRGGNQQVGFATGDHDTVRASSGLGSRTAAATSVGLLDGCQMNSLDGLKMPTARRPDAFFNAHLAEGKQASIDWSYVTNANVRSLMPGNTVATAPRRRGIDLDRQHQQALLNSLDQQQVRLTSAYREPTTATASIYPSDIFAALCDLNNVPTRVLISTTLVGAIIGRGGKTIRQITNRTGANIVFQPKWYPFVQFSRLPQTILKEAHVKEEVLPSSETTTSAIGAAPGGGEATPDLAESQLVLVTGSRKQCSSAVESMLAICYQSTWGRKPGLLEPCLGLLVPQDVFRPFFRDRRYFRAIAAATGARVSFTVARLLAETPGDQQQGTATEEEETVVGDSQRDLEAPLIDRIIVVRGSLSAVCAAEAYLSEQIRLVSISRLVPTPLWPLLPIQWLASSEALGNINHLLTLIAAAYWPQSLARQLSRSGSRWCESDASQQPYHHHHHHRRRQRQRTPEEVVEQEKERQPTVEQVEGGEPGPADSKVEQEGTIGDREKCDADERKDPETGGGGSDDQVAGEAVVHDEQTPEQVDAKEEQEEEASPREDSGNAEGASASTPDDLDNPGDGGVGDWQQQTPATTPKESPPVRPPALSPSFRLPSDVLQQTLMVTFGPSAWLATKAKLYMRMSNNETGAIIGTGASRMRQIMQATGVQMHFSRSNIYVPREESAARDQRQQTKKSSPCSESSPLDDQVTTGEAEPQDQSPTDEEKKQSAEGEATQEAEEPPSEVREAEDDDVPSAGKENEDEDRVPIGEVNEGGGKEDEEQEQTTPRKTTDVYRLLTLTGSLQSQLAAQSRIFHHLESLHSSSSSHDQTSTTNRTGGGRVLLSTLICLPRQFLVWLNTRNPSLGLLVSADTTTQSPLDWLRSEVKRLGGGGETSGPEDGQATESLLLQTGIHVRQGVASFDAVDALLLDPNTLPLEVHTNCRITHFVLSQLHCMLALWLCGQSLHYTGGPPPTALLPTGFHPMPKAVGSVHLMQPPAPETRSSASRLFPSIGVPPLCSAGNPGYPTPHPAWCSQSSQQQDSWWWAAVASSLWTAAGVSGHLQQQRTPSSAMACSNPPAAATSSSLVHPRWGPPGVLVPHQRHLLSPSAGHSQYQQQQRTSVDAMRPVAPVFPHGIASGGGYPICRHPGGGQLSLGNPTPGGGAHQSWQRAPNAAAGAGLAIDVMTSYAGGPPLLIPPRPLRARAPLQHYPTSIAGLQQQPRRPAWYHQAGGRLNPTRRAFNYTAIRRGGDVLSVTEELPPPPPPVEVARSAENASVATEDSVERQQEHEEETEKDANLEISTSVDPPHREEDKEGEGEGEEADAGTEDAAIPQDGDHVPVV